jgi:hypothetical protein
MRIQVTAGFREIDRRAWWAGSKRGRVMCNVGTLLRNEVEHRMLLVDQFGFSREFGEPNYSSRGARV